MRIQNANTVDAALENSTITTNALPPAQNFFCPLALIGTRARLQKRTVGTHQVPNITANSSADTDPSNFESGDTTIDNVAVDVHAISKPAYLSSPEGAVGLKPDHLSESLILLAEADIISIVCTGIVGAANYGAADVSATAANLTAANLTTMSAACASRPKTLLTPAAGLGALDGDLQLGPNGYQYPGVENIREIRAAIGDAHTILAGPQALLWVAEQPESWSNIPPGEITIREILLPTLQIQAWHLMWINRQHRQAWQSVELLFGVAAATPSALAYAANP